MSAFGLLNMKICILCEVNVKTSITNRFLQKANLVAKTGSISLLVLGKQQIWSNLISQGRKQSYFVHFRDIFIREVR